MACWWVGTSGWSYAGWKGVVYPKGLAQGKWLDFYAERFRTVELNASFYRLPRADYVQRWAERTPDGFMFAVKAWRAITHFRRLNDCADHLTRFFERMAPLAAKTGPILFQLPPRFPVDVERLKRFLAMLPADCRATVEFRDPSWHIDAVYDALRDANAAFCPFELEDAVSPRVVSADFVYVRLHGREGRYKGCYDEDTLRDWAEWAAGHVRDGCDAWIFFDNTDDKDHAVRNAHRMDQLLKELLDD